MSELRVGAAFVRAAVRMLRAGEGTRVVALAKKFVVPVPRLKGGGGLLVIPRGWRGSFRPLFCGDGSPMRGRGLVFRNSFDEAWKAVTGDGRGALIVNEVPEAEAVRLFRRFTGYGSPGRVSMAELRDFIEYCRRRGLTNIYGTNRAIIGRCFVPIDPKRLVIRTSGQRYGWMIRDPRQYSLAVYIKQPFWFQDPSSTAQFWRGGGILMWHRGSPVWAIEPALFMRTYKLAGRAGRSIHHLATQVVRVR